jgi:hypothetical protein
MTAQLIDESWAVFTLTNFHKVKTIGLRSDEMSGKDTDGKANCNETVKYVTD